MSDGSSPIQNTMHLVERAQSQDESALRELFERYLPRVRRIAALRLGRISVDLTDVDDITQEAMTDAFRALDDFDVGSDGKFCNWLATLVENRIRMAMRAGRRLKRGDGRVQRFADAASTIHDSRLAGDGATPSQEAMGRELNQRMERVLLDLSEQHRELIIQRYFSQMSYEEIVESLGYASGGAVRAEYSRALKEFRCRLEPDLENDQ